MAEVHIDRSHNVAAHRENCAAPTIQSYGRTEIADATYAVASAVCNEFEEIGIKQAITERYGVPRSNTDDRAFPDELRGIKEGAQRISAADPLASVSDEVASIGDELQSVGTSFAELKDAPRLGEITKWMATSCKARTLAEILTRALEATLQPLVRAPLSDTAPDFSPLIELISADAHDLLTIHTQLHALEALESLCTSLPSSPLAPHGVPSTDLMAAVTDAGCLPPVIRKLRSNVGDLALAAAGCLHAIYDLTARGSHDRAPERTEFVAALGALSAEVGGRRAAARRARAV